MKTRIVLGALAFVASNCFAQADGFFEEQPSDIAASSTASFADKAAKECGIAIERGAGYTKATDRTGHTYTFRFMPDGRLSEASIDGTTRLLVVYDSATGRSIGAFDPNTGLSRSLSSGKGPGWVQELRAQGKLPNLDKLLARACGPTSKREIHAKYLDYNDEDLAAMMTQDYWSDIMRQDFWDIAQKIPDPIKDCTGRYTGCVEDCDHEADAEQLMLCAPAAIVVSEGATPFVGAVVGLVCVAASVAGKYDCHENCRINWACS